MSLREKAHLFPPFFIFFVFISHQKRMTSESFLSSKEKMLQVIYSVLPHKCAEGDKITVRNLQNQKDPHNMEEAGDIIP